MRELAPPLGCKRVWVTIVLDELLQGVVIDDKVPAVLRDPANVATKFHHEKTETVTRAA